MRGSTLLALVVGLSASIVSATVPTSFDHILVKCGPPAGDLVNGTYVTVGSRQNNLIAQVTEYKKGTSKKRIFKVKQAKCPCPKAFDGEKLRLQVSDFSMSWLTQGPKKSNYLATLEFKNPKKKRTLGVACSIL